MTNQTPEKEITLQSLYLQLNAEELKEVEENLDLYLEQALRQYERIKADPEAYARFKVALTDLRRDPTIKERSNYSFFKSSTRCAEVIWLHPCLDG